MRKIIAAALISAIASSVHAEEIQLQDGRKIELHQDGTWSFISKDRLLGTADGREVRVREDGTWEYTGDIAPAPESASGEVTRASLGDVVVTLKELAIETARSTSHKNSRKKTQTVFLLGLVNNGPDTRQLTLADFALTVEDSGGREYPILQVKPENVELEPGARAVVEVRADGSPHWFTIKAMELYFSDGTDDRVVLKGLMSDARKRELQQE